MGTLVQDPEDVFVGVTSGVTKGVIVGFSFIVSSVHVGQRRLDRKLIRLSVSFRWFLMHSPGLEMKREDSCI